MDGPKLQEGGTCMSLATSKMFTSTVLIILLFPTTWTWSCLVLYLEPGSYIKCFNLQIKKKKNITLGTSVNTFGLSFPTGIT